MSKNILLVEDDESLGFVTKDNLEYRGYQVVLCTDGASGLATFSQQAFDLCILDVMLPKLDGFSLAKAIRQRNQKVPILFLTAKGLQEDKLTGFKNGGDDYITKPFSMEELVFRIEVFLKRSSLTDQTKSIYSIGKYVFDFGSFSLTLEGKTKKLTGREAEILQYLCAHQGEIVKRKDILLKLWGDDDYFKGRSLDVFISKLRKAMLEDPTVDIENYHGVGFKLVVRG